MNVNTGSLNAKTPIALLLLSAATIAGFAPFIHKAFNIDDPLFLWTARHIQGHFFDPYGFSVNWTGTQMPMAEVTKNPPLAAYYIALVASLFGWSEVALHTAFLVPAIAVITGTYVLARRMCRWPLLAALTALATPAFLVSGTTVMCDVMMLAFWVWAIVLWLQGIDSGKPLYPAGSALLIAAATLTKYYGISLVPLLLVYSAVKRRSVGWWLFYLLLPILVLVGYELLTRAPVTAHGKEPPGLFLSAFAYAHPRPRLYSTQAPRMLVGLAFAGGGFLALLFYAPLLVTRRIFLAAVAFLLLAGVVLIQTSKFAFIDNASVRWLCLAQWNLFALCGAGLLVIAGLDVWRRRDADSALLSCWVAGTFVFATFLNWTLNERSVLPLVPAAAIMTIRSIEKMKRTDGAREWHLLGPLLPGIVAALLVASADYRLANAGRAAAMAISRKYDHPGKPLWFQGHWGFQYYMQLQGAKAIDQDVPSVDPGDIVVMPLNNANLLGMPNDAARLRERLVFPVSPYLSTVCPEVGAGFYADLWGPLPFAIGPIVPERYDVWQMK